GNHSQGIGAGPAERFCAAQVAGRDLGEPVPAGGCSSPCQTDDLQPSSICWRARHGTGPAAATSAVSIRLHVPADGSEGYRFEITDCDFKFGALMRLHSATSLHRSERLGLGVDGAGRVVESESVKLRHLFGYSR